MSTTPWHDMIVAPRTVQASPRTPGMTLGRTPQSAPLSVSNLDSAQAERNRAESLIHPTWERQTPEVCRAWAERVRGTAAPKATTTRPRATVTQRPHAEMVALWADKAAAHPNPGKFILNTVPERYRADVVRIAASCATENNEVH